jgi:hypothetical protein
MVFPPASMTRDPDPTSFNASAFDPTTTNRPPRTATASTRGCASLAV